MSECLYVLMFVCMSLTLYISRACLCVYVCVTICLCVAECVFMSARASVCLFVYVSLRIFV